MKAKKKFNAPSRSTVRYLKKAFELSPTKGLMEGLLQLDNVKFNPLSIEGQHKVSLDHNFSMPLPAVITNKS